jgi:hypothetical protein
LLELDQQVQILSRELGFVLARGRLAELAVQWSEKSENLSRCGFDSRLLIEGPQWEEWVQGEGKATLEAGMSGDIPVSKRTTPQQSLGDGTLGGEKAGADGAITPGEEDVADIPWCDGRRKCERHFGWQKLCYSEYELNKGTKVSSFIEAGFRLTVCIGTRYSPFTAQATRCASSDGEHPAAFANAPCCQPIRAGICVLSYSLCF